MPAELRPTACLLLLLLAGLRAVAEVPADLVARSPSRYVRGVYDVGEGESVAMTCSFANTGASLGYFAIGDQSFSGHMILWYRVDSHGGQELIAIGTVVEPKIGAFHGYKILTADSSTSVLFIRHAAANHAGFYKCALSDGGPLHQIFFLNLTRSHLFIRHPLNNIREVDNGATVRLSCNVTYTHPRPLIYWTRGRGRTRGTIRPLAWGPVLTMHRMTRDFAGTYTCHANDFLTPPVSTSFVVKVGSAKSKTPPEFLTAQYNHAPQRFSVPKPRYGHLYVLSCRSSGYPSVSISWFKNNKNVADLKDPNLSVHSRKSSNGDTVSELQIRHFKLNDRGVYGCKAYNTHGSKYQTFTLYKIRDMPSSLHKAEWQKPWNVPPDDEDSNRGSRRGNLDSGFGSGSGSGEKMEKQEKQEKQDVGSGLGSGDLPKIVTRSPKVTPVSNFTTTLPQPPTTSKSKA